MPTKREQKEFIKALKKKFTEDKIPKKEELTSYHPTIIVGGDRECQ